MFSKWFLFVLLAFTGHLGHFLQPSYVSTSPRSLVRCSAFSTPNSAKSLMFLHRCLGHPLDPVLCSHAIQSPHTWLAQFSRLFLHIYGFVKMKKIIKNIIRHFICILTRHKWNRWVVYCRFVWPFSVDRISKDNLYASDSHSGQKL